VAKDWLHETVEHARRATELRPSYAQAYLFLGLAWKLLGEPNKAIEPLRIGITCRPDFELQLALGEAFLDAGQDKDAEIQLENARLLNAQDPRLAEDFERLRRKKN